MAVPSIDRQELRVASYGGSTYGASVQAKSSFWTVFARSNKIYLSEYGGSTFVKLRTSVPRFSVTNALDSGNNLVTDRFWLWEVTSAGVLNLVELEPYTDKNPVVLDEVSIFPSGVVNAQIGLDPGFGVRLYVLESGVPNDLKAYVYSDIKSAIYDFSADLEWSANNLDDYSIIIESGERAVVQAYSQTSSPGNIYTVDYGLSIPQFVSISQVGDSLSVSVEWDTIVGTENYRVERSKDDPTFASSVIAFSGLATSFIDSVSAYNATYYYRVKQEVPSLSIESDWSTTGDVTIGANPFASDELNVYARGLRRGIGYGIG